MNSSKYVFWEIKKKIFVQTLLDTIQGAGPTRNNPWGGNFAQSYKPKIKVNRLKANNFIQRGLVDNTGTQTIFGQIFQYFKGKDLKSFAVRTGQTPFTVQFKGEGAIDVGGPYNETISQICSEL